MGSSVIFNSLQEMFPEVDARLLKAVSIEHPKSTAEAVEVVWTEVIPCMSERSNSSSCSQSENQCPTDPLDEEEDMEPDSPLVLRRVRKPSSSADVAESGLQSGSDSAISDCGSGSGSFSSSEHCSENGVINIDDDNALIDPSRQICKVDLLERVIEDARNNKKILFGETESLISLMREVELKEEAAEQAREEAAKGGSDILVKVEEIRKMLSHAKEGNDMHAGEVYAEKAILATEVRELQTRLLSLSHEKDASLAILNEMRESLESRLALAKEVMRAARLEKQEKEESAKNALREQEVFMEKVVQESKILEQQAVENSKLQEFLMNRGRAVDMLQGEISLICQDVKALKESFDKRIPLSQSITSTQTTCKLASSNASIRNVVRLPNTPPDTPKDTSPTPSMINGESPRIRTPTILHHLEDTLENDDKALLEDGWDFLESVEDTETAHN